jgi:hypothetical protein
MNHSTHVLEPLVKQRAVLLTTYRRDGTPVGTAVNIVVEGDLAYIRTWDAAWKLRYIRNSPEVEFAPHDPEVAGRIYRYGSRTEDTFEDALTRAKKAGEISADRDPKALARFLVNTLHGLRVLARAGSGREVLDDAVSVALGVLR